MKVHITIVLAVITVAANFWNIAGHGMVMDPVNRSSAWRKNFSTPENYEDNQNYCGGFFIQHNQNDGKCGPCGDNYMDKRPRQNENGGKYGTGTIVKKYYSGDKIELEVLLTTNHLGWFSLSICPLKSSKSLETEACFSRYPLRFTNGSYKYRVDGNEVSIKTKVYLPKGLVCKHCVLRWHYHAGNNWGMCGENRGDLGCGPQETFRSCSDIRILERDSLKKYDLKKGRVE